MSATSLYHTAGLRFWNQVRNKANSVPTTLYLLLRTLDGTSGHTSDAAAADTLSSNLNEVSTSGTGYARIAITVNSTNLAETLSGINSLLTYAASTFNFTGTVTGITHAALATTSDNTGVLLCSAALSVTRNVANGDSLAVTFKELLETGS